MPATYAAVSSVLEQISENYKEELTTMIDVGAGTGAVVWATNNKNIWNDIKCLEREESMISVGKQLMQDSELNKVTWEKFDILQDEIKEKADLVITHGGVGSIVMALKMGKKVIAVPRLSAFGEHINDHQIQIVDSFDKQDFLIGVTELDDLEEALNKAKTFKPKHFKSETDHMIKIIEDFIDNN